MRTLVILIVVALAAALLAWANQSDRLDVPRGGNDSGYNGNSGNGDGGGVTLGKCYVGGCSGQICSDEEGVSSTCEFRPEYACYRNAKCERQASGECGWTQTADLKACLGIN